ncbi:ABC transporter permease [Lactiplantibacillus xiangfangensis]|uniref:Phosphonate ABC transporter permease n=1 Tax=Lactiplantibacillus xiangfangensis TaxID=942150 RepID=A0A0R2M5N7_9LACO|nr:ABC transporter permease subunit [Lactiplantibacillus xiangfangensis]KRO09137.1 phosphonate ABC transporter permease [Lactiplantibacillus xiangfangensis]
MIENSQPKPETIQPSASHAKKITLVTKPRKILRSVLAGLTIVTIYSLATLNNSNLQLSEAFKSLGANLNAMFLHPSVGQDSWALLLRALATSVSLAMLTTLLGALIAFFIAVGAARNLAPNWLATSIKAVMAFVRAIPTILWVLIYSVVMGLGASAAVVGLTFHSVAYLVKAYSESIEETSQDTIEALKASGVGFWPIVFQAILPSIVPALLSWTFIRFEINFANAVAVGAAAGADDIGYYLFMAGSFYFNFHEVGLIVYLLLAVAIVLELVSMKLRGHYLKHN